MVKSSNQWCINCYLRTPISPHNYADNARQCGAHFINDGVTIAADGLSATFEFEGTGPNATVQVDVFQCRVNSNSFIPCKYKELTQSSIVCVHA